MSNSPEPNVADILVVPEVGGTKANAKIDRTAYLANLLKLRQNSPFDWLTQTRDQAAAIAAELAIPSTRDEAWRFTDLTPMLKHEWQVAASDQALEACDSLVIPEAATRLVFMNGVFQADLSSTKGLPDGAFVGSLGQLNADQTSQVTQHLGRQTGAEEVFTALNTASFLDSAIVWIPRNTVVEQPIHLVFLSRTSGTTTFAHPRCLVIAETGSQVKLVEEHTSADKHDPYFTNTVTEIYISDNAKVNHTRVQWESPMSYHVGKTAVSQGRDSQYVCNAIDLGATISRHNLEVHQHGEQADTQLYGLSLLDGTRTADTHSLTAFSKPHGTANQLHKCIADDQSHGVFNGSVYVPKLAQETDAAQLSRNLLLSNKARIDTKPELEIIADNVKCAHGATVSQLEDDEVFYLQSRGIAEDAARKLLKFAFAIEVINKIPVESLRNTLTDTMRAMSN
ncbi:Fe-S cluster assembly protein SufD [filamentous cyanobacterium LEGE 11480]|uniref:Fe-S cluster assembly protein SufD n=1 Tax=Romeriopsis navalis LEGE 11480 TaxID=2777977 RepID=A0A928VT09_9CYAN|nr:Fe-S cluster assembly protein SufD [Romeriopsis navalis]MBE9032005.1 Fe-S cluster assembly protein SufD [Romeriopsis navalis LEGE 11480]